MLDENKEQIEIQENPESSEETGLTTIPVDLNEESLAIITQLIAEKDEQKTRDLTHLFNANQNKKTMVRVNKLSDLLDTITDQALTRFTSRPDEISNKELFDGLKVVQDLIERGQKQVSDAGEMPLIQINQQNNELNLGSVGSNLNRDSRERVKSVVMNLLDSLTAKPVAAEESDIIEVEDIVEVSTEDDNNG